MRYIVGHVGAVAMTQTQARWALVGFALFFVLLLALGVLLISIGKINEGERGVVLFLGRLPKRKPVISPGLYFRLPLVNEVIRVDVRVQEIPLKPIRIVGAKNIPMTLMFDMRIIVDDPVPAVVLVESYKETAADLATQVCQEQLSNQPIDKMIGSQVETVESLRMLIREHMTELGLRLVIFNVRDVDLPPVLMNSLIREAAAEYDYLGDIYTAGKEGEIAAKLMDAAGKYFPDATPSELAWIASELRRNRAIEDMKGNGSVVVASASTRTPPVLEPVASSDSPSADE